MLVTVPGITSSVSPMHPLNAWFPMDCRPSGRLISVRTEQPANAFAPILVIVLGRTTFSRVENSVLLNVFAEISVVLPVTWNSFRVQPSNAGLLDCTVHTSGLDTISRLVQFLKA